METLANWAASKSGSETLMALASSTLAILLAKFIWTKIWPLAILLATFVIKLSCAPAGPAASVLKWIFQRTAPVRAAPTIDVELQERDGGTALGRA